jgi:hypothetical protein
MNKLLLLLIVGGIIYILYKNNICENMSNIIMPNEKKTTVSLTILKDNNINMDDTSKNINNMYVDFTNDDELSDKYVMINYNNLSSEQKQELLSYINDEKNNLKDLQDFFNPDNVCSSGLLNNTLVLLINNKQLDIVDNNILTFDITNTTNKTGQQIKRFKPYNTIIDKNNNILNSSILIDSGSYYFDENGYFLISSCGASINTTKLVDINLNKLDFMNMNLKQLNLITKSKLQYYYLIINKK